MIKYRVGIFLRILISNELLLITLCWGIALIILPTNFTATLYDYFEDNGGLIFWIPIFLLNSSIAYWAFYNYFYKIWSFCSLVNTAVYCLVAWVMANNNRYLETIVYLVLAVKAIYIGAGYRPLPSPQKGD